MNNPSLAGLSGCLLLFASMPVVPAYADDPLTIVVTASRAAETVDETMVPVTIIDNEEIQESGAYSVGGILHRVPGMVVTNNGGPGKTTSVFLRGTESDHILVLIDGVKVGSATLGTTPFQDIPLSMVEKIEVVRGPRSSLYGSEAIGGVIQIFTKKGSAGYFTPSFSGSLGSHNSYEVQAGASSGDETGWFNVNTSASSTDGFNACRGDFTAGCFTVEPDDDGYSNESFSMRGGGKVSERVNIESSLFNSSSKNEFDGSFQNEGESDTQIMQIKGIFAASQNWESSLQVSRTTDESDNFLNEVFASRFDTERQQLSWLNEVRVGSGRVIAGIDYIDDEVDSSTPFDVTSRNNLGYFASYGTSVGATDLEASLRGDDNEQFGTETTGGVAVGRDIGNGKRMTASYGTAFKAPTFNELYFPGFGNPDLDAETSSSIDLGLSGSSGTMYWTVNAYNTQIDDLIAFDPMTFAPVNINEADITGIEVTVATSLAGWDLRGSLTLQNPEDASGGVNDGNQLPRRAEEIFFVDIGKRVNNWRLGGSLHIQGDSYDDLGNFTKLDGFTVVNVRAEYLLKPAWAVGLHVNNLFDEEYETAANFNQDGTNGKVTLRYIPGQGD